MLAVNPSFSGEPEGYCEQAKSAEASQDEDEGGRDSSLGRITEADQPGTGKSTNVRFLVLDRNQNFIRT